MYFPARYGRALLGRYAGRLVLPAAQPTAQQRLQQSTSASARGALEVQAAIQPADADSADAPAYEQILRKAQECVQAREWGQAEAVLRQIPKGAACWRRDGARVLAGVRAEQGDLSEAERILRDVLSQPAGPSAARDVNQQALGVVLFQQERWREAAAVFVQSVGDVCAALGDASLDSAEAQYVHAAALAQLKEHETAVEVLMGLRATLHGEGHQHRSRAPVKAAALELLVAGLLETGRCAEAVGAAVEGFHAAAEFEAERASSGEAEVRLLSPLRGAKVASRIDALVALAAALLRQRQYPLVQEALEEVAPGRRDAAWLLRAVDAAGDREFTDGELADHVTTARVFQASPEAYAEVFLSGGDEGCDDVPPPPAQRLDAAVLRIEAALSAASPPASPRRAAPDPVDESDDLDDSDDALSSVGHADSAGTSAFSSSTPQLHHYDDAPRPPPPAAPSPTPSPRPRGEDVVTMPRADYEQLQTKVAELQALLERVVVQG